MGVLRDSQLVIFSLSPIFITFSTKRLSLQTLAKFKEAKTGSGIEVLRLSSVWVSTLRRSVSEEKQNSSGNQKILPGLGRLGKFSGRHKAMKSKFRKV